MNTHNKLINLNGREYKLNDSGEGGTCLFLTHQHCENKTSLSMLAKKISASYRVIMIDITDHFPVEGDGISELQLNQLLDDLHLLCDVYWLDKVLVRSDYQPALIRAKFKERLLERYQAYPV